MFNVPTMHQVRQRYSGQLEILYVVHITLKGIMLAHLKKYQVCLNSRILELKVYLEHIDRGKLSHFRPASIKYS